MTRVCKLMLVVVNDPSKLKKGQAKQSNKFYNMTDNGNGTIAVEYGRVDSSCTKITKPSRDWDKIIKSKVKKGYKDVTHIFIEDENVPHETKIEDISDSVIDRLFKQLQAYANKTIVENYKISSHKVTQAMIDEAQSKVDQLANILKTQKHGYVDSYNHTLLELFHIIPRRMDNVANWLVNTGMPDSETRTSCEKILGKEQSTLDVMAGQVVVNSKTDDADNAPTDVKRDILDVLGLTVEVASEKDCEKIKGLMAGNASQFHKAYKVVNKVTQAAYDKHMKGVSNKKTELFWHGSRNENWLNIISTGLLIRPSGAVYSGSMFGDGIYFADKAQKSIGYTSLRGSYWANGNNDVAYLALYSVHVGSQKVVERSDSRLCWSRIEAEGHDSTFAKAGSALRNNEYIIYRSQQCTISYLIEIRG